MNKSAVAPMSAAKTLADQESDFTAEGSPPPGKVSTSTPVCPPEHREVTPPPATVLKRQALAELRRRLAQTEAAIAERRIEELKVLADGFARKLAANGFSIREAIEAMKPYLRVKALTTSVLGTQSNSPRA